METTPVFELFGKIAGIGGLGLAVALVVFRDVILNGAKDADHHWEWFRDIAGTCANCVCFEFNKTVYLP